ncbi:MAG: LON peptidase substrate-binding domain-containing protein [Rhodospirillales bacterium]|nr:LON peptidase substrate-binding domain-containing protein [Rhodospirillales bacterium]
MERNPFAPDFGALPDSLPVFPLGRAFLLPSGQLPLNIFEARYVQMVEDALVGNRLIGMVQPAAGQDDENCPALVKTGCAGKIIEFSETGDGRYLITLSGVYRFDIVEERTSPKLYRIIKPNWGPYETDCTAHRCLDLDRAKLKTLLHDYFTQHDMDCDWGAIDDASDGRLITCLSMVCPFEAGERQALLEAACCRTRAQLFMSMLEIAVRSGRQPHSCYKH